MKQYNSVKYLLTILFVATIQSSIVNTDQLAYFDNNLNSNSKINVPKTKNGTENKKVASEYLHTNVSLPVGDLTMPQNRNTSSQTANISGFQTTTSNSSSGTDPDQSISPESTLNSADSSPLGVILGALFLGFIGFGVRNKRNHQTS